MSLINQMLCDLETRRGGGRVEEGARALEGLQPAFVAVAAPAAAAGLVRLLATAATAAAAAAVAWYGLQTFELPSEAPALAGPPPAASVTPPSVPIATLPAGLPSTVPEPRFIADVALDYRLDGAPELAEVKSVEPPALPPAAAVPADSKGLSSASAAVAAQVSEPTPEAGEAPAPAVEYRGTLRKDAHVDPTDPAVALRALLPRLRGRHRAAAQSELEALVTRVPTYVPARHALASELLRQRQTPAAEKLLRAGLALSPQEPRYAELLAHVLLSRGDAAGALEVLTTARPGALRDGEFLAFMAALEQRLGRHADAIATYRAALALTPARGAWWAGLGISLAADAAPAPAREAFARALADRELPVNLRRYAERELAQLSAGG